MFEHKPKLRELQLTDSGAKMLLQNVRIAFVNIAAPDTRFSNKDPQGSPLDGTYTLTALIAKDDFAPIKGQLEKTLKDLLSLNTSLKASEKTKALKTALAYGKAGAVVKDGDTQTNKDGAVYDGLAGCYTLAAKSKAVKTETGFKPKVPFKIVNSQKVAIEQHKIADEIYSGVYCDIAIMLRPYSHGTNTGVSIYLNGIMKLVDGSQLGGSDPFEIRDDVDTVEADFTGDSF